MKVNIITMALSPRGRPKGKTELDLPKGYHRGDGG